MKLLKYISIVFFSTAFISCNDWIDLMPEEDLIRDEYWKTKEDVEAVLMGAYSNFAKTDAKLFKLGEIRADMVEADYNQNEDERNISESNIYPENEFCKWDEFYKVINLCNEVIHNAADVQKIDNTFSDFLMKGYVAEAHFLRSLCYFYLVRAYKDVPYHTFPTETDDAEMFLPKTPGDEIIGQCIADLKDNYQFITIDGYITLQENKGRATKAAYNALLADMSLWLFDYEAVITYVDRLLALDDHVLLTIGRWFELFFPGNSAEGIFEFQFDDRLNQSNGTYAITEVNSHQYLPSEKAIKLFIKDGNKASIERVRGLGGSVKRSQGDNYIIWKYVGMSSDGTSQRSGSVQKSCNWIVYRLADVLLMKAEALSQLERFAEAYAILNEIRLRGTGTVFPVISETKSAYEDAILEERARELAFEGKRWFDLLRMGRRNNFERKAELIQIIVSNVPATQRRILQTKLSNPQGWYFPIFEDEIERNKFLEQNPFYIY
jgi:starch-binding outer membrane protein, SusD/RagB family